MKKKILFCLFFCILLFVNCSYAGVSQLREKYPSAHLVLKNEIETITYLKDGSYIDQDEVSLIILDQKGKLDAQVQSFYVNRHYSKFKLSFLEVIKPDGKKIRIDIQKNSRWEAPSSDVEMNIYDPNVKVLKVFVPELRPGDTIHYKTWRKVFKPVIPGQTYGMVVIQQDMPVDSYHLALILPREKRLYHMIKEKTGRVAFKTALSGDKRKYIWDFKEIPMLVPEPNMVPFHRVAMRLLFSTLSSWEQVSRWYYELVEPKLKPTRAIEDKVKELVAGKRGKLEKIMAIFSFVAQKIRYLGITAESNRPGFEPHDVSLTFSRRYGVCRDKAALLVSMLRLAGFSSAPVLLSMENKLDKEIVVPYFNHAIAAILDKEGNPIYFLDPTSETSRQFLPDYDRNCSYLIASKAGGYLGTTPANMPENNLVLIKCRDRLGKDGIIRGEIHVQSYGFTDTVFRAIMLNKSHEEQKKFLARFFEKKRSSLHVKDIGFSNPLNRSIPFSFWCRFELKDAIQIKDNKMLLWPLSCVKYPGLLDRWIIGKANLQKRRYPLRFGYVFSDIWTEEMDLSALKHRLDEISFPVSLNKENRIFSYYTSQSFSPDKFRLNIKRYLSLRKLEVSPEEYPFVTRMQHDMRYEFLFPIIIRLKENKNPSSVSKSGGIKGR